METSSPLSPMYSFSILATLTDIVHPRRTSSSLSYEQVGKNHRLLKSHFLRSSHTQLCERFFIRWEKSNAGLNIFYKNEKTSREQNSIPAWRLHEKQFPSILERNELLDYTLFMMRILFEVSTVVVASFQTITANMTYF